ncbi:uncharacterized protein PAC_00568 [Phialocephala subalpina]|uniref:Uncharacterized protein n=1 Tax=Phialocephala subalpina TaxID=576137 RepID=A0A1L7WD22_9HELO|nr:uncharacterized protein PAC_00568 [Phialocephala subalpina]
MDNLQDRQDVPIWNAVEAKNYKQALKLVDKRLAKKPTDYLEAVKTYIRSLLPQASEKSAVFIHLEELVNRKSSLSDLAAIDLYEDAFEEVLPGARESWIKTIGELRWQCVKTLPKQEDICLKCFRACLDRDDLDHARQIANSLEKNFPKSHSYIFWNITSMFLFASSPQCPESQKRIWGGLSSGQIGKLAAATREATDLKQLPVRSIQTPQELLLLDRITETFGQPDQRLEYLQDLHLGPESAVAKGDWALWILKLKLMREANRWQELFDLCGTLLKRAREANDSNQLAEASFSDWIVWEAYLKSASKLESHKYYDQIRAEVEAHLDPACKIDKAWKRNASLASVKLTFASSTAFSQNHSAANGEVAELPPRLSAVVQYLQKYGDANTAYDDLRQYVEALESNERARLLIMLDANTGLERPQQPIGPSEPEAKSKSEVPKLSTADQITRAINRFKLKYLVMCSIPEHERKQSLEAKPDFKCITCKGSCGIFCQACLEKLAEESINSYQIAVNDDGQITKSLLTTDRHPADDLCVLTAMCLIKLALIDTSSVSENLSNSRTTYLLQATVLLESAWPRSKSNFQLSLMLVRLYSYFGCGSLAMRAFQRLFLKQIQLDTLSYTMFDRISSFHPHPISDSSDGPSQTRTLIEQLQKQQQLYKKSREHINKNNWLAFKHGSYNAIFEFREVTQKLSHSFSAVMSVIENNKIHRFTTNTVPASAISQMHDLIPADIDSPETTLSDNNDYETFPNYESSLAPTFEELSRFIPGPAETRYRLNLLSEKISLIVDPSPELSGEKTILEQSLKQTLDSQKQSWAASSKSGVGSKSMTRAEQLAGHAYRAMRLIITESCDQALWAKGDFKSRLEGHNSELRERLEELAGLLEEMEAVVPAFQDTLNAVYTAYEVGRTAVYFCRFLNGKGKTVYETQTEASKKIGEAAERLIQVVVEKCAVVKKGLDEGGWIDKVLESVFPESEQPGFPSALLVEAVRQVPDEVFMEEWAGEVVESWKESAAGFSYMKMPSKA